MNAELILLTKFDHELLTVAIFLPRCSRFTCKVLNKIRIWTFIDSQCKGKLNSGVQRVALLSLKAGVRFLMCLYVYSCSDVYMFVSLHARGIVGGDEQLRRSMRCTEHASRRPGQTRCCTRVGFSLADELLYTYWASALQTHCCMRVGFGLADALFYACGLRPCRRVHLLGFSLADALSYAPGFGPCKHIVICIWASVLQTHF